MERQVPFSYDPRKEEYKIGLGHLKLQLNDMRTIVVNAFCSGCDSFLGIYPIHSRPEEDGYWRVRCSNCESILYEELMENER